MDNMQGDVSSKEKRALKDPFKNNVFRASSTKANVDVNGIYTGGLPGSKF